MRYNKAGTLDGEVNLELPDVEEVEVEVRRGRRHIIEGRRG